MPDDPQKKYFDVSRPSKKSIPEEPSKPEEDSIKKTVIPIIESDQPESDEKTGSELLGNTLMEPAENEEDKYNAATHAGFTITPLPDKKAPSDSVEPEQETANNDVKDNSTQEVPKTNNDPESQATEPLAEVQPDSKTEPTQESPAKPADDKTPEESPKDSKEQPAQEPEGKDVPIPQDQFANTDSVENNNKKTAVPAEDIQDPKIYDTKEYYVPIGKIHHKHGGLRGAFVFGIICALLVVAATLYVLYRLGQS